MGMVHTTKGSIDREDLIAKDIVFEEENARMIATEWYLKSDPDGELVRRDVWGNILVGQAVAGEQATI